MADRRETALAGRQRSAPRGQRRLDTDRLAEQISAALVDRDHDAIDELYRELRVAVHSARRDRSRHVRELTTLLTVAQIASDTLAPYAWSQRELADGLPTMGTLYHLGWSDERLLQDVLGKIGSNRPILSRLHAAGLVMCRPGAASTDRWRLTPLGESVVSQVRPEGRRTGAVMAWVARNALRKVTGSLEDFTKSRVELRESHVGNARMATYPSLYGTLPNMKPTEGFIFAPLLAAADPASFRLRGVSRLFSMALVDFKSEDEFRQMIGLASEIDYQLKLAPNSRLSSDLGTMGELVGRECGSHSLAYRVWREIEREAPTSPES